MTGHIGHWVWEGVSTSFESVSAIGSNDKSSMKNQFFNIDNWVTYLLIDWAAEYNCSFIH